MPKPTYKQLAEEIRALKEKNIKLEQSNEKLLEGDQIYRALFEHAGFAIALIDPKADKFVVFNTTEHESFGYTKDEFKKLPIGSNIVKDEEEREKHSKALRKKGPHYYESRHRAKNGDIRDRFISSVECTINGKIYHLNIASDITHLKKVEKVTSSQYITEL